MSLDVESSVRALVFDMDGTLVDSMPWHLRSWAAVLAEHGVTVEPRQFLLRTAGMTAKTIFREWLGPTLSDSEIARLTEEKETLYRRLYAPHVRSISGADEFLKKARDRGIGIALATAAPEENVTFILSRTKLGALFDVIVTADDGFPGKPAPEIFLAAAARLGIAPRRAIVFEDALNGVEAARRAGMRVVVLSTTLAPADVPRGPDVLAVAAAYDALDIDLLTATTNRPEPSLSG
jgi:beta-phosphoglucomutase family hydrolase